MIITKKVQEFKDIRIHILFFQHFKMKLLIITCLVSLTCAYKISKRQGTLASLSQADKDQLLKWHNDYRAGSGASNMMKMASNFTFKGLVNYCEREDRMKLLYRPVKSVIHNQTYQWT